MKGSAIATSQPFAEANINRGQEKQPRSQHKIDKIKHHRLLLEILTKKMPAPA
jgi:hypothetical protein